MLKLRTEQMEAFQGVADNQFVNRIIEHLRKHSPHTIVRLPEGPTLLSRIADARLSELVKYGLVRARSYGFDWESSISAFIVLMFKAAPNFHQYPDVQVLLSKTEVPPNERLKSILEKIDSGMWDAIQQQYNPSAWRD